MPALKLTMAVVSALSLRTLETAHVGAEHRDASLARTLPPQRPEINTRRKIIKCTNRGTKRQRQPAVFNHVWAWHAGFVTVLLSSNGPRPLLGKDKPFSKREAKTQCCSNSSLFCSQLFFLSAPFEASDAKCPLQATLSSSVRNFHEEGN